MDEFVPTTTDHVRDAYAHGRVDLDYTTSGEANDEFDRWLSDHDRRVRAEALRDAADIWHERDTPKIFSPSSFTAEWLREHADMIERGDQ